MTLPPPIDLLECYWVLPGRLLAGEYPAHMESPLASQRIDSLLDAGIEAFVDLTAPDELQPYLPLLQARAARKVRTVDHRRFPIPDRQVPGAATMRAALDSIDAALAAGRGAYVHCWGGVGRTGMVVACWLMRHGRDSGQALAQIAAWRQLLPSLSDYPRSPETDEQIDFVHSWHEAAS